MHKGEEKDGEQMLGLDFHAIRGRREPYRQTEKDNKGQFQRFAVHVCSSR